MTNYAFFSIYHLSIICNEAERIIMAKRKEENDRFDRQTKFYKWLSSAEYPSELGHYTLFYIKQINKAMSNAIDDKLLISLETYSNILGWIEKD